MDALHGRNPGRTGVASVSITPARGPPLWDDCDAQVQEGVDVDLDPEWDPSAQASPEYQVDQRINW